MENDKYTLSKGERISRKLIIDRLFLEGKSFVVYPLRVVYLAPVAEQEAQAAIMVSVPKKRFKRAVKRNFVKRRVREAYRLDKHRLLLPSNLSGVAIAFLYLSSELKNFESINSKMQDILGLLSAKLCSENC